MLPPLLQVVVTMLLLVSVLSWAPALAGIVTMLVLVPVTGLISRRLVHVRHSLLRASDARLKLTTEVLLGIKTIKCAPLFTGVCWVC